ncbi:TetR family transcriptional regulator [Microbacterium panaciterrae]|uniref:TetR family transcriptional regulator n=1 Tax=Microbacterium panaciterrae TaxID=985759 RepID=A0ABP8PT12_9MICO
MTRHAVDRSADLKARIRDAAEDQFSSRGYAATSIRDIAAAAGVDPSIVIRHFGSKEALFVDTVRLRARDAGILSGPISQVGERLVRQVLAQPDDLVRSRGAFAALLRASDSDDVQALLRQELKASIIDAVEARLPPPDAKLRAHLFCAQLIGLFTALWVIEDVELTAANRDALAVSYGALLQQALTGDIFSTSAAG